MVRKAMFGAAVVAISVLGVAGAAGAQYGGGAPVSVVQGESVSVTGDDCAAGATVDFTITSGDFSASGGSTTADSDGEFTTTVVVPVDTPVGPATLTATCGDVVQVLALDVTAASSGGTNPGSGSGPGVNNGALPRTGSDNTQTLLGVGAGFLLLGGTLAIGARRTRRSPIAA